MYVGLAWSRWCWSQLSLQQVEDNFFCSREPDYMYDVSGTRDELEGASACRSTLAAENQIGGDWYLAGTVRAIKHAAIGISRPDVSRSRF